MIKITLEFPTLAEARDFLNSGSASAPLEIYTEKSSETVEQFRKDVKEPVNVTKVVETKKSAPTPPAEETKAAPAATATGSPFEYDTLKAHAFKLAGKDKACLMKIIADYGVKTLKDLPSDKWASAYASVDSALAGL